MQLTSDFADKASVSCFAWSGGNIWSCSAANIAVGTFTSEKYNIIYQL